MGNYATTADLEARFENDSAVAHLTDTWETGTPDDDVLAEVLNYAEGTIDSHLAQQYLVPVDVSGSAVLAAQLKSVALDIAVRHLITRHGKVPESKEAAYDDALAWLLLISERKLQLPSAAALPSTATRDPLFQYGTAGDSSDSLRKFTRATQRGF